MSNILDDIVAGLSSTSATVAGQYLQKGVAAVGSYLDPYTKGGQAQTLVPVTLPAKPAGATTGAKSGLYPNGQPSPGMPDGSAPAANRPAWLAPAALLGAVALGWYMLRD